MFQIEKSEEARKLEKLLNIQLPIRGETVTSSQSSDLSPPTDTQAAAEADNQTATDHVAPADNCKQNVCVLVNVCCLDIVTVFYVAFYTEYTNSP